MKCRNKGWLAAATLGLIAMASTSIQAQEGHSPVSRDATTAISATGAHGSVRREAKKNFRFEASCSVKCTDGVCRSYSCRLSLQAESSAEARLKAALQLSAQVQANHPGSTIVSGSVRISISF